MGVGAEPGVISEIPAWVIWVVVYHDVVAVPQPIAGVVIVVRRDAPEKAAKPETVTASAFEAVNVIAANFAAEVSVFKRTIEMVISVVAAPFMAYPLIVSSMHVRSFGMAWLVAIRCPPLVAARTTPAFVAALCLNCSATSVAALWLSPPAVRRWAVSGYVTAANLRAMITAASPLTTTSAAALTAASTSVLGKRRKGQNQKNCKQTR